MPVPVYMDEKNGFNEDILHLLDSPLGMAQPDVVAYFERCIDGLSRTDGGSGVVNGHSVYADPATGIIMAAVIGDQGVALRVPQASRSALLQAGGTEYIEVEGSKLRLGNAKGDLWEGWIATQGALNVDEVRKALADLLPVLVAARAKQIARTQRQPTDGPLEQPANALLLGYLKALPAGAGSSHPEFASDFFHDVPKNAGINPTGVVGQWVNQWPVMRQKASGVIFGYYDATYALILRVPLSISREAVVSLNAKGQPHATLMPDIGDEWMRCSLATLQEYPQWLVAAYTYAE
jgi:hypothetical protein